MIAGWSRIVYKQKNLIPSFSRPAGEAPVIYSPYWVNPYDNPIGGWFSQTKAGLFQWHYAKSNNELFSIIIPDFLLPPTTDDATLKSSDLKNLIPQAWDHLKQILVQSVPLAPLGDPATYKFPVHDIITGETKFYTIAEIEKMTKSLPSAPSAIEQLTLGKKIRNYLGPRQERKQNVEMIDYDLDFSTATISLSYNINSPISVSRVLNSLALSDFDNYFDVEEADVFGTVKHNGKWLGIRLAVTVKD